MMFSAWICAVFAFGATIFFVLLCVERPVWAVARGAGDDGSNAKAGKVDETELQRVHTTLRALIPMLPPANGLVVVGGTALVSVQTWLRGFDVASVLIALWYVGILLWTIFGMRIARSVADVRSTPSGAPLSDIARGVARLIRAHRAGLLNTTGPLALQLALVVHS